jgi:uncharacterized protein (TIGR03435 family)
VKRRIGLGPNVRYVSPQPAQSAVFTRISTTLTALIRFAFDLQDYESVGGPDWIRTDRFDIDARADREVSTEQMRVMVQSLLEDRFRSITGVLCLVADGFSSQRLL